MPLTTHQYGLLRTLTVDLSLDKEMLKAVIAKNGWSS